MKREDIERAACSYAEENSWYPGETSYESDIVAMKESFAEAFNAGADWRMNSVWHKTDEMPKNNKMFLCITETYSPLIGGPDNADYKETFKALGVTKWAYVEDLLPDYAE